jgi:hypothetical protein
MEMRSSSVQRFLIIEAASFIIAALIHWGVIATGYEYSGAALPEGVIGTVLLAGLILSLVLPARTRMIGLATQGFALAGTLIGLFVVVIGVGPNTLPDLLYHIGILGVLLTGLVVATRFGRPGEPWRLTALSVVHSLVRATGLLQLALGLAFWTGNLLVAVPFHIFNGILFVLLLEATALLAAMSGASRRLVAGAIAWGVVVILLGLTQTSILPGDLHWIVRLVHLAAGLVALGLAERLAMRARLAGLATPSPVQAGLGR